MRIKTLLLCTLLNSNHSIGRIRVLGIGMELACSRGFCGRIPLSFYAAVFCDIVTSFPLGQVSLVARRLCVSLFETRLYLGGSMRISQREICIVFQGPYRSLLVLYTERFNRNGGRCKQRNSRCDLRYKQFCLAECLIFRTVFAIDGYICT